MAQILKLHVPNWITCVCVYTLLSSCGSRLYVEKRHYRKGIHWNVAHRADKSPARPLKCALPVIHEQQAQITCSAVPGVISEEALPLNTVLEQKKYSEAHATFAYKALNSVHANVASKKQENQAVKRLLAKRISALGKSDFEDFRATVMVGYMVVLFGFLLFILFSTMPFNLAMQLLLLIVLIIAVLFLIGKAFRGLMNL